jgi:outer membrane receptor protein involved in Fe transport
VLSRVRLVAGLRWDNVDDESFYVGSTSEPQRAWSPRAGIVLRLTESGSITTFGQVSRAFKVPTLDQLFDPRPYPDFQGGTFTISNPTLVPQRATNVEAGVSGGGRVRWSALAYHMNVEDEIDFDIRTFSYANIGRSRHTGLELEADTRIKRLSGTAQYSLARVTSRGEQNQLRNIPQHAVRLGLGVELPWALSLSSHYASMWGAFLDDANLVPIEGSSVVDLRIRRPLRQHAIFVDMLNVTADRFEEYGFTLQDFSGGVVPYVYPGAPRAFRAGLTLNF